MKFKIYQKTRPGAGAKAVQKAAADGAALTDDQLSKINQYALSPLTSDDVYARKYLIAHNMVDRDRERFSEPLLDDFAKTFPGKSYLFAHDRREYLPLGLIFDAATEDMTPEQFTEMTGEPAKLPDNIDTVKVVWAWFYIPRTETAADIIKNIEAGIYRHGSIGFGASDLAPVKGEFDQIQFWEYQAPGEAQEASLVWLGAQQGATTQKAADEPPPNPPLGKGGDEDDPPSGKGGDGTAGSPSGESGGDGNNINNHDNKGDTPMKTLKLLLGKLLGKSFGDEATEEQIAQAVEDAIKAKDKQITDLEAEKQALTDQAEMGKKWRKSLTDDYVRMKTALGECEETEDAGKKLAGFADQLPVDFIESEVKALQKRMTEKFPASGQLPGDARQDKSGDGAGGEKNPLIPEEK